jgi:hypothetical protein
MGFYVMKWGAGMARVPAWRTTTGFKRANPAPPAPIAEPVYPTEGASVAGSSRTT